MEVIMSKIILKNGPWYAEISPLIGANVTRLDYNGEKVLRRPEESVDAYQFGMPILIPANRTENGRFTFEGKTYRFPVNEPHVPAQLHGLVHDRHFTVDSYNETSAELSYCSTPDIYPFPFRLTVRYELKEDGIYASHHLENIGDGNMPFTFCLHTTFQEPKYCKVPLALEQAHNERYIPTGEYTQLKELDQQVVSGTDPHGKAISGFYSSAGQVAIVGDYKYTVSDNYDHWVLYNAGGYADILCVEPQCGGVNGLNQPGNHRILSPGASMTFHSSITR